MKPSTKQSRLGQAARHAAEAWRIQRYLPATVLVVVAGGWTLARGDIATVVNGTDNATVQPAGPRSGANGKNFFNMEGDNNSANSSYGVLDIATSAFLASGVSSVDALTLTFTEANSSFTHAGSVEVFLASDTTANIQPGTATIPGYTIGLTPEGIGANPLLIGSTVSAFGTLTDLGSIAFNTNGNVSNGTLDTLTLTSISPAVSAYLASQLNNINGDIRFVLTPGTPTTSATWAGTGSTLTPPTLSLTYSGSTIALISLLWTGGSTTWNTSTAQWQNSIPNDTTWNNNNSESTYATFATPDTVSVDAGGVSARGLSFLNGSNGLTLNGPGTITLLTNAITVASSSAVTIAATIATTSGINLTGGGSLTLTGSSSFTGNVALTSVKLYVSDSSSPAYGASSNPFLLKGGTLVLTGYAPMVRDLLVGAGTSNTFDTASFDIADSAHITNAGGGTLTRIGSGILSFDNTDSNPPGFFNSGMLIVNGGTVRITITDSSGFTALGSGTAVMNSGTTFSFYDASGSGGLFARSAPNLTLNAGSTLTASGTVMPNQTIIAGGTDRIGTTAGNVTIDTGTAAGNTLTINAILSNTGSTLNSSALLRVVGSGLLQLATGATTSAASSGTPPFSGSWEVAMAPGGIASFGPIVAGGTGEPLNGPGYHLPSTGNTSNHYAGATNLITITSGTVAFAADSHNINNTSSTLTVVSFRSPLILNGGNIASSGLEYDGFTPVTANLATDITSAAGKTSSVLLYDPVAVAAGGTPTGYSLNVMTDPAAVATNGTASGAAVSTNLNWGAGSTLIVDATGVTSNFGALNFLRIAGTVTVGANATLQINPNAIVNLGGTQDALSSGTAFVNITNQGALNINNATKNVGTITGAGTVNVATGATLISGNIQAANLTINGAAVVRPNASLTGRTSAINNLTLAGGASLDLTNNNMIVAGGTNVASQIKQAATLGTWTGTGGITSSAAHAAATTSTATALAYASGAEYSNATGNTTFDGLAFNPTDALIKYTLAGDANMDGSVTFADFLALQNNYNKPGDWAQGDWNYDGQITFADFLILQNNYNKTLTLGNLLPSLASSPAPEPASLALLAVGGAALLIQRRRKLA